MNTQFATTEVSSVPVAKANKRQPQGLSHRETAPIGYRGRWLFAVPALVLVAIFFLLPLSANIPLSFANWTSYSSEITFNGLRNFQSLSNRGALMNAITFTLLFALIATLLQISVSLALAYAMRDSTLIANSFFRSLFFLPVLVSPLAGGYIWLGILHPEGPLNAFISLFVPGFDWAWLGERSTALPMLALIDAWKASGITTLVFIAGINSIPRELIQAAVVDGASGWQRFWWVIVPLLAPAFTFNIVITLIGSFGIYDLIMATTQGGPGSSTRSINFLLRSQWGDGNFGAGSALGMALNLLIVATAIPLLWWLRSREVPN